MSGGIAYIYDPSGTNRARISTDGIDLTEVSSEHDIMLHSLVQQHLRWTGSQRAQQILSDWDASVAHFVKVFPREYRRLLRAKEAERKVCSCVVWCLYSFSLLCLCACMV
jgi:glutamate synthase (NADPH/NADH) large chain